MPIAGCSKPSPPSSSSLAPGATGSGGTSGSDASTPVDGGPPPCPASCTITSQTVATSPTNRARTRIGVGEEVALTVSPAPANWAISAGTGKLSPAAGSHATVRFTADDTAGTVTITATGAGCTCSITFTIVEPSSWTQKRSSGLKHSAGRPDCGWKGEFYIHPDDVNFYRINFREKDSQAVTTGSYTVFNGVWHGNYPPPDKASPWLAVTSHTETDGSKVAGVDQVYSGDPMGNAGTAPPFTVGTMYFPITMQWRVGTGAAKNFPTSRQEHEIFSNGKCESRKGGNTESRMYNDPASSY